jgi:hypothetical protein
MREAMSPEDLAKEDAQRLADARERACESAAALERHRRARGLDVSSTVVCLPTDDTDDG